MNYPESIEEKLGFDIIRKKLASLCLSSLGVEVTEQMSFLHNYESITLHTRQTAEYVGLLNEEKSFPEDDYHDLRPMLARLRPEGMFPEPEEVVRLRKSMQTMRSISKWFEGELSVKYPELKKLAQNFQIFPYLFERIDQIITSNGRIKDNASAELQTIRHFLQNERTRVSKQMQAILRDAMLKGYTDDDEQIVVRDGRLMIPVKASFRRKISGIVHDESATGKTVYVEPQSIIEMNNEIRDAEHREKREIINILKALANDIRPYIPELSDSYNKLAIFDFIRAKALLAKELNAIAIPIENTPQITFRKAINPLLFLSFKNTDRKVVGNTIELDKNNRILLISGPNAGGKSVAMKTVGILQYMLQCGLLIPVSQDSVAGIFEQIFIDIGDDQSIDNDLSTYSSHLMHMKHMLKKANQKTLVLIDEFGSGTEPIIGGAIAEAVLEQFKTLGLMGVITTHYSNLKHYAANQSGLINGAMLFDTAKIEPTYRLETGKPGSSFAIEIAFKSGLPKHVIDDAKNRAGTDQASFDKHLREIMRDKKYYEEKRQEIKSKEKKLEKLIEQQAEELEKTQKLRDEILKDAKIKIKDALANSNKLIENTIREIKEAEADKEKTKEIRRKFDQEKEKIENETGQKNPQLEKRVKNFDRATKKHRSTKTNDELTPEETIAKGDSVRIQGQTSIGEIIEINEKNAVVAFGAFITSVAVDKLEKTSKKEQKRQYRKNNLNDTYIAKQNNFKPGIDLRGKYVDEALQLITDYVDEAIMLNANEVKILHGKGNGILRKAIREYLSTIPEIAKFEDEHIEFGGAGITVVKFK